MINSARSGRTRSSVLGLACCAMLITGCAGPAGVPAPTPSAADRAACSSLVAATPDTVDGHDRRETDPPSDYTAAWGDPAITLSCGVPEPAGLTPASQCFEVNGVGWFAEDGPQQVRFSTIGRRVTVTVVVPRDYAPEANPLVDLAGPITEHVPAVRECV